MNQSWQPEIRRDDLAQHCAVVSVVVQQAFFLVRRFMCRSPVREMNQASSAAAR